MSTERPSRENDPTIRNSTNAPPCTDFITAVPMSVIVDVSLRRKYLILVKTTHEETLKAQKSTFKIGKLRYRPQYRIYSETGKDLIVSEDKKHSWIFTWPNEPHKECRLVEHSRYCDAVFSNPCEEGTRVEMGGLKQNKTKNTATAKVLATTRWKGLRRLRGVVMMDKDVDVVLMTGFIMATAQIAARRAASASGGWHGC